MIFTKTLLSRTTFSLSLLLISFVLLASSVLAYYIMFPIAQHSAANLAGLIKLSTKIWQNLPLEQRPIFTQQLQSQYQFFLNDSRIEQATDIKQPSPFLIYLKKQLDLQLQQDTPPFKETLGTEHLIWIQITNNVDPIWLGFSHQKIGPNPPLAFFLISIAGIVLVIGGSLFFVSYLNRPLKRLLKATKELGKGKIPAIIQQSGPEELLQLTQSFNHMNQQIQTLSQNRMTLLSGISHDLRTPIARIQLALEMLDSKQEELIQSIQHDLNEMNQLIQNTLDFSRGLNTAKQDYTKIEIHQFLQQFIHNHPKNGLLKYQSNNHYQIQLALNVLNRVLNNLLDNALRYSANKKVYIYTHINKQHCYIHICDQGTGIAENQLENVFQPFYRLEASRNSDTGGSGLGLAIVQQLCQAQGWKIQLKNIHQDQTVTGLEAILRL